MSANFFLDSNILVYARDGRYPEKQAVAARLVHDAFAGGSGRISRQVTHEFYVTVTSKLNPGLAGPEAREAVRALEALNPLSLDGELLAQAWRFEDRFSLSFWDALIVAAAKTQACELLYSEDFQHELDIDGLIVLNPFI